MLSLLTFGDLGLGSSVLLVVCIGIALAFEFVNGFHDTANAVATVIYTNSLRPRVAVVLSGICNFLGVFVGGIAVAIGIVNLLPVELLVSSGTGAGLAMVLALLLAAILWNLGTWYLGLPASSSHTLIGAILGVGLANSLLPGHVFGSGVNWHKAGEIGLSLLLSPLVGFFAAGILLLVLRRVARASLFAPPVKDAPPPGGVRGVLVATCGAVSFAHGSNDGQKGVGLVMLILMGLLPASYALDATAPPERFERTVAAIASIESTIAAAQTSRGAALVAETRAKLEAVRTLVAGHGSVAGVPKAERFHVRQAILVADKAVDMLVATRAVDLSPEEARRLAASRHDLRALTDYAPAWVLVAIAVSLGIGTMVGWKRIVVTVGEKIGKSHLTYAQGASAEVVAASTIFLSAILGLPVSTTHVLSSGIAGTMVAQRSGLQAGTVRKIALAWLLTLPASIVLSGVLFLGLRAVLA